MSSTNRITNLLAITTMLTAVGCSKGKAGPQLGVAFDHGERQILVTFPRDIKEGETLHARVRQGKVGALDCARDIGAIPRIDEVPLLGQDKPTWRGPLTEQRMFEPVYDTTWLELPEPTQEMLDAAAAGDWTIDVCLMKEGKVVQGRAFDIQRALDDAGGNGKFDGEGEERIESTVAYAELCVAELGDIPFFKKVGDGDYETYNCLDSTAIPTTVTSTDGTVSHPETEVNKCDNPQYIYSLCEPNAVDGRTNGPRVATRGNDEGTQWVLLCRKAKTEQGSYNDIAMIGHNPFTGKTCYFQNALYSKTDGLHVPHPGDKIDSEGSPQQSASLWKGIHGGVGSGIECAKCHSTDPFIHTPWIDGAKDANGDSVVPKMGEHEDFVLGFNDAPYSVINKTGQGWTMPKQLVAEEASACTKCHRIGANDRWMNSWNKRLDGTDTAWNNITTEEYLKFKHKFWMPPEVDGLDDTTWADSEYGKAIRFIMACQNDSTGCDVAEVPTSPISDGGGLPEIDLEGVALATESLKILGADIQDPSCPGGNCETRRCLECHSVSRSGLRRWLTLTDDAWNKCKLDQDPGNMSQADAKKSVDCLRVDPEDDNSVFEAAKLGILTTGAQYTDFRKLFQKAYGADGWLRPYVSFKARVGMPKGSHPKLSQKEYATLIKWFKEDLTKLNDVLADPPPPQTCEENFNSSAISAHIADMRFDGWAAVNEENGIRMHGCGPGAAPSTCFSGTKPRPEWAGTSTGSIRELTKLTFRSSFWTRSSADGRYVGNGGGPSGSTITDLATGRDIGVKASYDPGFFPDNSGFIFQGSVGGAGICSQSMLESDELVDFSENACMTASGVNLYQHVARGTNGGDYFIINSQFTSDSGSASSDPSAHFSASSTMKFTPMVFNGTTYEQMNAAVVDSPFEGDSVLSPSGKLVISRLAGPNGKSLGYVIRKVVANRVTNGYQVSINEKIATICTSGAKANISYDERFVVTHTYENNRANLVLIDLTTGNRQTITNMPENSYAMFPHFRSDGWIYFLVKSGSDEWIAASDAAVRLAQ